MTVETKDTILPTTANREVSRRMKSRMEVQQMLQLHREGNSPHRIAVLLGCSRTTVVRYIRLGQWQPPERPPGRLATLEGWLEDCFVQHQGNADVVRQELRRQHGIEVSLRTVERAVQPLRRRLQAALYASVRFESLPGEQMQIDFGTKRVAIGGSMQPVHLFVATLGYSRRQFAAAYPDQSQRSWMDGMERAFRHFGGVPRTVLMDNAKALVNRARVADRETEFHSRLLAFARHWGFRPRACRPHRAQTKGKDERSVGYVKHNALAGRTFGSWGELDRHLQNWLHTVADPRIHGSTGETPQERFVWERPLLTPVADHPSFGSPVELTRKVSRDCVVALDTNQYSVPWTLVGDTVRLSVTDATVRVYHGSELVACHGRRHDRHRRVIDRNHFAGLGDTARAPVIVPSDPELVRPLQQYEELLGGSLT